MTTNGAEGRAYFNTTAIAGPELAHAILAAEEQNDRVLRLMREAGKPCTPWEIWERGKVGGPDDWWLIGSVRRAMTTLADERCGALVNLGTKRRSGPRNKLCYEWALPEFADRPGSAFARLSVLEERIDAETQP